MESRTVRVRVPVYVTVPETRGTAADRANAAFAAAAEIVTAALPEAETPTREMAAIVPIRDLPVPVLIKPSGDVVMMRDGEVRGVEVWGTCNGSAQPDFDRLATCANEHLANEFLASFLAGGA